MAYFLYILRMSNGRFYVGTTAGLQKRLKRHLQGDASRTTSAFGTEEIVYTERHPDRSTAEKRERQIKKWSSSKKTALVRGDLHALKLLSKRQNCH